MQIRLFSNNSEAWVSPFIGRFLANVCTAIAASLKAPRNVRKICYELEGEDVRIQINGDPIALNMSQGFARIIVGDTLRGMIRHLKGMNQDEIIRIEVEMEDQV